MFEDEDLDDRAEAFYKFNDRMDAEAKEIDWDALGPTGHGDVCTSDADPGL